MEDLNNAIKNNIQNRLGLESINVESIFIPPRGSLSPQILRLESSARKFYIVKLINPECLEIGEETLIDVLYDLFIGEFMVHKKVYPDCRVLTGCTKFIYKKTYYDLVVSSYIEGFTIKTNNDLNGLYGQTEKMLKHLSYDIDKNELTEFLISHKLFCAYYDPLKTRIDYLDKIKYVNHFRRDIMRTTLSEATKQSLLGLIDELTSKINHPPSLKFVHGDLKTKNILVINNKYCPIDWSRSHFGDEVIDFAGLIGTMMHDLSENEILEFLDKRVPILKDQLGITRDQFNTRLSLYLSFLFFSVARVWAPQHINLAAKTILSNKDKSTFELLKNFMWIKSIRH